MVKKYSLIVIFLHLNINFLHSQNDSSRNHFFEISYFKSLPLKSGIFKMNQRGINLKVSLNVLNANKYKLSINPFYTNLTNVLYRGNFVEKPAIEAYSSVRLRADVYGLGIGIERELNKNLTLRTEFGISNTANSLFSRRDRLHDYIECSNPNDSSYFINTSNYKEVKFGYYGLVNLNYKLSKRISFSLGYLFRSINYDVEMETFYYTCGLLQNPFAEMRPSVSNLSLGLRYNFSLEKFK
jgi:hypothetical protein